MTRSGFWNFFIIHQMSTESETTYKTLGVKHKRPRGQIWREWLGNICCITGLAVPCCPFIACGYVYNCTRSWKQDAGSLGWKRDIFINGLIDVGVNYANGCQMSCTEVKWIHLTEEVERIRIRERD